MQRRRLRDVKGLDKFFKRNIIWFFLAVVVIILTSFAVYKLFSGTDEFPYQGVKPFTIITGPPENQLRQPIAVALGLKGELYVADSGNKRIVVFQEDGRYAFSFGSPGSGLAEMGEPIAIAIAANGNVFVADREKQAVLKFNSEGEYLGTIADKGTRPLGVQVDKKGNLHVFDGISQKVLLYEPSGKKVSAYPETKLGELKNVELVGLFPEEKLTFGINSGKPYYHQYNQRVFEKFGENRLASPKGIGLNRSKKLVFISDTYKDKVVVFDLKGQYLGEFGQTGDEMGQFQSPGGLTFDERGKLFVADTGNNRVVVYTY